MGSVQDGPRLIVATPDELKAGTYDSGNIQAALEALHQDGFAVLKGVVDVAHVEHLNEYMSKEADELVKNNSKPFNQGVNWAAVERPCLPVQRRVLQLLRNSGHERVGPGDVVSYLGYKPIHNFITGNNALPHTAGLRQPVHKDIVFYHPQCPFYVIANIPLCDFSKTNGATEFWLGSHAHTTGQEQVLATPDSTLTNAKLRVGEPTCNVLDDVIEQRRAIRPPIQPICQKGDIMLRDLRTWHAGMPNESDQYRIMLALGYQAQWYPNHTLRSKLPLSQGNFFMKHAGQPVEVRADLLPDDSDFGKLNDIFSFRQTSQ
ncbi:hypothetical protein BP5796_01777 [Coleophoma crateriformis]|uniref:Phytanoyl-dioxygenase family protein n=1 Tax=Coleophoma crateriformis TaxID=565419 RepID=A0A3D8T1D9_9HELO|nr:hypothetical protein BP5796_01777 [Coleophoma crateriformis]